MQTTLETIKSVVAKLKRNPDLAADLDDNADLVKDVRLDSLELLQFMLDLEERMNIRIDFEALEFSFLNDIAVLADFLERMPPREQAGRIG
jgi:acyl carrier protein